MMQSPLLTQIMHIPVWLQEGRRHYKGVLLVLGVFTLALVIYSFQFSRGDHNPSLLFHYTGYHLDSVRSRPHDVALLNSQQTPTTHPFNQPNSEASLSSGNHGIVLPHEEQPSDFAQRSKRKAHSDEEYKTNQAFMTENQDSDEEQHQRCKGRYVYVYKLPPEFNDDLVDKCGRTTDIWVPLCGNLNNNGYGPPITTHTIFLNESDPDTLVKLDPPHAWYRTEQFTLEVIFHHRLEKGYPCLTQDPELASAFFIPYYAAMDAAFTLFDPHLPKRDRLAQRLIGWLRGNEVWTKFQGAKKHFMVLGRISWDFSRDEEVLDGWGSSLLSQVELSNVTRLSIERNPSASNDIAIPYPTSFHPSSLQDMELWQETLRRRMNKRSKLLSSLIGSPSRGYNWSRALRAKLATQCNQAGATICQHFRCGNGEPNVLDCGRNPEQINGLFLSSTFCFQPTGDSPTRKGIFDSLLAGCIPVLFTPSSAYTQYMWHLPKNGSLYSVLIDGDDVIDGKVDVFATLTSIANDTGRLHRLQKEVISLLPSIVYSLPGNKSTDKTFDDAVDVALEGLLADSPITTF